MGKHTMAMIETLSAQVDALSAQVAALSARIAQHEFARNSRGAIGAPHPRPSTPFRDPHDGTISASGQGALYIESTRCVQCGAPMFAAVSVAAGGRVLAFCLTCAADLLESTERGDPRPLAQWMEEPE